MSPRYTPAWDRFVEEWNTKWWEAGLDIVSSVIFRDESTDRVGAVYYLKDRFFVSYYNESDIVKHNCRDETKPYEELDWPLTCLFYDEDRALTSAVTWIDDGKIDQPFTGPYTWWYDYACGHYWDSWGEEE